jgi:hypothetical protein
MDAVTDRLARLAVHEVVDCYRRPAVSSGLMLFNRLSDNLTNQILVFCEVVRRQR